MSVPLVVCGGKSTALEIAETARRFMPELFSPVIHAVPDTESADGKTRVHARDLATCLGTSLEGAGYIVSMSSQSVRAQWVRVATDLGLTPSTVVHPFAYVSESARLGRGVYLAAHVVVSAQAEVADHVIVSYNVTIGHDSKIGNHTLLNPGARVSGNVTIGQRTMVGSNAFIFQGLTVGDDCLIDAMTYVDRDIESRMICSSKQLRVHRRVF